MLLVPWDIQTSLNGLLDILVLHTAQRRIKRSNVELNQSLRNRDMLKDDAISQLSDQLVALSTRLQEIEKAATNDVIYCWSRPFIDKLNTYVVR